MPQSVLSSLFHTIISSWHHCAVCNLIQTCAFDKGVTHTHTHTNHQLFSTNREEKPVLLLLLSENWMAQTKDSPQKWCNMCVCVCVCVCELPGHHLQWGCSGWRVCTPVVNKQPTVHTHTHTHTCERSCCTWVGSVLGCLSRERLLSKSSHWSLSGGHKAHASHFRHSTILGTTRGVTIPDTILLRYCKKLTVD